MSFGHPLGRSQAALHAHHSALPETEGPLNRRLLSCRRACRALSLAACGGVTDAALAAVPLGVRELSLVCCERVTGWALVRLCALRALRLPGCSAVELGAVQARSSAFGDNMKLHLFPV